MAGLWYKSATNVWSKAKGVHYKNASNVWTKAKGLRYKNATNVWSGNVLQTFDVSYQMGNGSYTNGLITLSNPSIGVNSIGLTLFIAFLLASSVSFSCLTNSLML